jgi:uncharacterized cofD-like protein
LKTKTTTQKVSKMAAWLLPGLQIKRWFILIFLGTLLLFLGAMIFFNIHPIHISMELVRRIALKTPSHLTAAFFITMGIFCFFFGWKNANMSILDAVSPKDKNDILETLYKRRMLNRGPKIVAIGGGTGLSTVLKGLKNLTNNLTAVVTVGDDGGSSGRLREEMGVLPPGDIRNCIAALADEEDLVTELFQYRFNKGTGLEGHSFGNLFLSALCAITGDMFTAIKESSKVLAIRGKVLPSTLDDMRLIAELEDGRVIQGESNIPRANGKIKKLYCEPKNPTALPEVLDAINNADFIIISPGSLYTSIIPNILIEEIAEALSKSTSPKGYICNVMTQPGETDNFTVSDHIKKILDHSKYKDIIDTVFLNSELPKNLADRYQKADSFPVIFDEEEVKKLGVKIITRKLIEENKQGFVRHCPRKLARITYVWYKNNFQDRSKSVEERSNSKI